MFGARTVDRDAREPLPHTGQAGRVVKEVAAAAAPAPAPELVHIPARWSHRVVWHVTLAAFHPGRGVPIPAIASRRRARFLVALLVVALSSCRRTHA